MGRSLTQSEAAAPRLLPAAGRAAGPARAAPEREPAHRPALRGPRLLPGRAQGEDRLDPARAGAAGGRRAPSRTSRRSSAASSPSSTSCRSRRSAPTSPRCWPRSTSTLKDAGKLAESHRHRRDARAEDHARGGAPHDRHRRWAPQERGERHPRPAQHDRSRSCAARSPPPTRCSRTPIAVLTNTDATLLGKNAPVQQDLRDALQEVTLRRAVAARPDWTISSAIPTRCSGARRGKP